MADEVKPKQTYMTILAVENGYVVSDGSQWARDSRYGREDHVFESFAGMVDHLRDSLPIHPPKAKK